MAGSKRPSFLKRQKEQKRLARAAEKREARRARKEAKAAALDSDEPLEPAVEPEVEDAAAPPDASDEP